MDDAKRKQELARLRAEVDRLRRIEAAARAYFEVMVPTDRIVRGMRVFRLNFDAEPAKPLTELYDALGDSR